MSGKKRKKSACRMGRLDERLDRVERRLDLAEA